MNETTASADTLAEYGPAIYARNGSDAKPRRKLTMRMVDALAGSRNNFITVLVPNPKKPTSIAYRNWHLYEGNVTVADFLKSYPRNDGGVTRARASLIWDFERGFVTITGFDSPA